MAKSRSKIGEGCRACTLSRRIGQGSECNVEWFMARVEGIRFED